MKILGVRVGFTTNNSSTTNWSPGQKPPEEEDNVIPPFPPDFTPRELKIGEVIVVTPIAAEQMPSVPPSPPREFSNAEKLGLTALFVALLFIVDRFVRWVWQYRKKRLLKRMSSRDSSELP